MFNATLAPITRTERVCSDYYYFGDDAVGNPTKGEVVHSIEVDWDETRSLREQYELKDTETILLVHYTTPGLVRQAEQLEAAKPMGSLADIWPSV